jgi:hypothetical protein
MNEPLKIWSALLLLIVSLGLLKFAYVTSNWHLAITALILGALFILTGLGMTTDREEPQEYWLRKGIALGKKEGKLTGICAFCGMDMETGKYVKEHSFKEKVRKETKRMNKLLTEEFTKPKVVSKAAKKK